MSCTSFVHTLYTKTIYYNKEGSIKMKTFTFRIFGRTIVIRFGKKPKEEIKMEENEHIGVRVVDSNQYISTVNEPDVPWPPTFYTCCVDYIECQRGKLAESTLKGYRSIIDNHLDMIMSGCPVGILTERLIQQAFDEEIAKGLSEKTLKGYRSFVLKVLAECRPDLKPEIRVTPLEVQE